MPSNLWQSVARNKNWRIGRTAPSNAVGVNGEFWLNDSTGALYEKINGVYVSVPVPSGEGGGETGPQGPEGPQGETGPQGEPGEPAPVASVPLPFIEPPGGWDTTWDLDASVMTNPDLAANGWTVSLAYSPYTVLTRAGDVRYLDHVWAAAASSPTAGTTYNYPPAAGTYYSTLIGGRLLLQIPGATAITIWRATTPVASVYTAGVGGGTALDTGRLLFTANGAPASTGVRCGYVGLPNNVGFTFGATSAAAQMPTLGGSGVQAMAYHFALEAAAYLNSPSDKPVGRYLRPACRPLHGDGGVPGTAGAGALIDTGHGVSGSPAISRAGVLVSTGPTTFSNEISMPLVFWYIRRRPHRADAYW